MHHIFISKPFHLLLKKVRSCAVFGSNIKVKRYCNSYVDFHYNQTASVDEYHASMFMTLKLVQGYFLGAWISRYPDFHLRFPKFQRLKFVFQLFNLLVIEFSFQQIDLTWKKDFILLKKKSSIFCDKQKSWIQFSETFFAISWPFRTLFAL